MKSRSKILMTLCMFSSLTTFGMDISLYVDIASAFESGEFEAYYNESNEIPLRFSDLFDIASENSLENSDSTTFEIKHSYSSQSLSSKESVSSDLNPLDYCNSSSLDLSEDDYGDKIIELKILKKGFLYYCQEKKNMSLEINHTVDVILEKMNSHNCIVANQKLSNIKDLDLSYSQIKDIKPLASLEHLETLDLSYNDIKDISELSRLENLKNLFLGHNAFKKVAPLLNLKSLSVLGLGSDNFEDIDLLSTSNIDFLYTDESNIIF